ncbi:PTS cellobiose transporter subunit IIC [uncultured Bacteroides sp.]|uniref:chorismate transformation enzyme, FkbO/Hyg5 family n=1 Tax=uncultured Bacteroides sp. TaxID=162156 RepID=UPI002626BF44|nr:PTS cellobiose transporter subunit IIC [uncultured Bacteroides sp.]
MFLSCYYKCSSEKEFDIALADLLRYASDMKNVVRLVFFGSPTDTEKFKKQRSSIALMLKREFQHSIPAYTYLAQPLLDGGTLGVEIQVAENCDDVVWEYPTYDVFSCVKLSIGNERMLFISGIFQSDLSLSVRQQSEMVMEKISCILLREGFTISDIVRQWNYIEHITGEEVSGRQRYQEFNDVRSRTYGDSFIDYGYPAATGIGTQLGGIQIELDAFSGSKMYSHRVDNPIQRAAYEYSSKVLVGSKGKTTPKFERARSVSFHSDGWIYISGTAAIRGEMTIETDAGKQAELTLDNIRILLSDATLKEYNIQGHAELKSLRVYVKRSNDIRLVKQYIESSYPSIKVIYVNADICRDNLLVEMEGYAIIRSYN